MEASLGPERTSPRAAPAARRAAMVAGLGRLSLPPSSMTASVMRLRRLRGASPSSRRISVAVGRRGLHIAAIARPTPTPCQSNGISRGAPRHADSICAVLPQYLRPLVSSSTVGSRRPVGSPSSIAACARHLRHTCASMRSKLTYANYQYGCANVHASCNAGRAASNMARPVSAASPGARRAAQPPGCHAAEGPSVLTGWHMMCSLRSMTRPIRLHATMFAGMCNHPIRSHRPRWRMTRP